jgi:hypothetical protein
VRTPLTFARRPPGRVSADCAGARCKGAGSAVLAEARREQPSIRIASSGHGLTSLVVKVSPEPAHRGLKQLEELDTAGNEGTALLPEENAIPDTRPMVQSQDSLVRCAWRHLGDAALLGHWDVFNGGGSLTPRTL